MDFFEKLKLIYNYIYKNKFDNNLYQINDINPNNLTLNDLKYKLDDEKTYDYLADILSGNIKLISEINNEYDNNNILIKNYNDNYNFTIIINFYQDKNINEFKNNRDSLFSYLFSNLILSRKTKHLLCPIMNLDVSFEKIIDVIKKLNLSDRISKLLNNSKILSLNIKENYFKTNLLADVLDKCKMKYLLFQVIHTLFVLQNNFKNFRHNNLTVQNILVYFKEPNKEPTNIYKVDKDLTFSLPDCNFDIKIFNFNKSYMPNLGKDLLNDIEDKKIPFLKNNNYYFDLHYFLNTLLYKFNYNVKEDRELNNFLLDIFPKNFRGKGKNNFYLEKNIEFLSMKNILKHKYFKNLIDNKKSTSDYMENTKYYSGKRLLISQKEKKKLKRSFNQKGGSNIKTKLSYQNIKNDPFINNEERSNNKKKFEKEHDSNYEKPPQQQKLTAPMYIPVSNDINNPEKGFYAPYKNKIPKIPLTQNYHIHLSDPSKQVSMLNRIYEDMVPNNPFPLSYIKVSERLDNMKFIRNSMVKVNDGEEMTLVGSDDSFLSYVKLLKFNPYSLMTNPYRDLAKGFMLFNIAYPITFNKVSELIELPRTTMGYNLRIYELSIGAYKCSQLNSKINCHKEIAD